MKAPPSGRLFQEGLLHSPFWMLVACQLVNLTHWRQAGPVHRQLVARYLTPRGLAQAPIADLEDLLRPLGLWRRRALNLHNLSNAWLSAAPRCGTDVLDLPGCGKYAADSWAIFLDGRTDVEPTDGKLTWYLRKDSQHDDGTEGGHPAPA